MEHLQRPEFNGIKGLQIQVRFVDSEQEALDLEEHMIAKYGRKNLLNKVGGGKRDKFPFKDKSELYSFVVELESCWPKQDDNVYCPLLWAEDLNRKIMDYSGSSIKHQTHKQYLESYYRNLAKINEITSGYVGWHDLIVKEIRRIAVSRLRNERDCRNKEFDAIEEFRGRLRYAVVLHYRTEKSWKTVNVLLKEYRSRKTLFPIYNKEVKENYLLACLLNFIKRQKDMPTERLINKSAK